MADKPPEEGYISVVDEEPEIFELLKWDTPSHTQGKQQELLDPVRTIENPKAKSPEKKVQKRQECDPFDLQEPSFIETYRLTKDLVRNLCEELTPVMPEYSMKCLEFSIESKVLAALSFYATGKYQKTIAGKTDPNITQYFVATAVMQVTEAMNSPTIVKKYIHFPHLRDEREIIKSKFYMKYGIPNVVGCIDCMHVPIARPENDRKSHFNKSYHSKKVQIICDSEMTITSMAATGGASSHDDILTRHPVKVDLESLNHSGDQCWLIGGSHYTQKAYIMTPIPKITKKTPVSPEKRYSTVHSQAHGAVLDTIKQLKSRWKCLQATVNKQFDTNTVTMIITACCVLNNICNRRGLPVVPMTQTEERLEAMKQKVANGPVTRKQVEDVNGVQARSRLVERLWSERRVDSTSVPKKRMSKKDRILESHGQQSQQPQVQVSHTQHQPHQPHQSHQQHQPHQQHQQHQAQHHSHHEDLSKRPRILSITTPTYGLGVPPGWGHYSQH